MLSDLRFKKPNFSDFPHAAQDGESVRIYGEYFVRELFDYQRVAGGTHLHGCAGGSKDQGKITISSSCGA